ncbi:MAG: hypothetical protein AAF235_06785, partial [Planctomycetota bacterium]
MIGANPSKTSFSGSGRSAGACARILGPGRDERDPAALLGLPAMTSDRSAIAAALDRRLAEVDQHAEARTPLADEVRLALHAAAARLAMAPRRVGAPQAKPFGFKSPGYRGGLGTAPAQPAGPLASDLRVAVALHRGWNGRALRHLHRVALQRGMPAGVVQDAIAGARAGGAAAVSPGVRPVEVAGPASATVDSESAAPGTETLRARPPARSAQDRSGLVAAVVAIAGVTLLAGLLIAVSGSDGVGASRQASAAELRGDTADAGDTAVLGPDAEQQRPAAVPAAPKQPVRANVTRDLSDQRALLHELNVHRPAIGVDPIEALPRFEELVTAAATGWVTHDADMAGAIRSAVIAGLFASFAQGVESEAYALVIIDIADRPGAPTEAEAVQREVWAMGLVT